MNCNLTTLGLIVGALTISGACVYRDSNSATAKQQPTSNVSQQRSQSGNQQDPTALCFRIPEIKSLPMKGERGEDPIYDAFMDAGVKALPCLIDKVTDGTAMQDPRSEPGYPDVQIRVGDVAYFLLIDITKLDFGEPLPPVVQRAYKSEGVYAYFEFVKDPQHRRVLQDNLRSWYVKTKSNQTLTPRS